MSQPITVEGGGAVSQFVQENSLLGKLPFGIRDQIVGYIDSLSNMPFIHIEDVIEIGAKLYFKDVAVESREITADSFIVSIVDVEGQIYNNSAFSQGTPEGEQLRRQIKVLEAIRIAAINIKNNTFEENRL